MKTKVAAFTHCSPHWGGSFQYAYSILDALSTLDKDCFDVCVFYMDDAWATHIEKLGVHGEFVGKRLPLMVRVVRKLLRWANKVIHSNKLRSFIDNWEPVNRVLSWSPNVWVSLEQSYYDLPGVIKVIGPVHDLMHRYERQFPEVGSPAEYNAREFLFSNFTRSAAAVLVDSNVGKDHVMECYGTASEKIHVLPFVPSAMLKGGGIRPSALPLDFDKKFIFYPAQFWQHKNHAGLLKALRILENDFEISCIFTGYTGYSGKKAYDRELSRLKHPERIFCLGYVKNEEIVWLYKNAVCMVMPTFLGPTNIPPLEAMQYGCPVAVSSVYGMPEQFGNAALYFDPAQPEEIANSILRLWREPLTRNALIQKGYEHNHAWNAETFKEKFLEIFYSVVR